MNHRGKYVEDETSHCQLRIRRMMQFKTDTADMQKASEMVGIEQAIVRLDVKLDGDAIERMEKNRDYELAREWSTQKYGTFFREMGTWVEGDTHTPVTTIQASTQSRTRPIYAETTARARRCKFHDGRVEGSTWPGDDAITARDARVGRAARYSNAVRGNYSTDDSGRIASVSGCQKRHVSAIDWAWCHDVRHRTGGRSVQ